MKRQAHRLGIGSLSLIGLFGLLISGALQAKISEPDHILYGNASWFGADLAPGSDVALIVAGQTDPIANYEMGSDPALGEMYALRVPMDSLEPREPGTARPGEQVSIYINGELSGETAVGEHGKAVRLDIDPNVPSGGGPNIFIQNVSVNEGDAGLTAATFTVSLSTNSPNIVSVDWATSDVDAVGGAACGPGVDYISDSGTASVPFGDFSTGFTVQVCGDTDVEADKDFLVELSNAQNGHISVSQAIGSIIDDDARPTISINDVAKIEPFSGSSNAVFTISLSQVWPTSVSVDYLAEPQTADAGLDFTVVSGTLTIPANTPNGQIAVPVLADSTPEPNETFALTLSNPVNADLADADGVATIIDPAFEPTIQLVEDETGVNGLSGPSAVAVSPDGDHVYVGGRSLDTLLLFDRDAGDGALTFMVRYDKSTDILIDGVTDIVSSSDGAFMYTTAFNDDAVTVLSRDPANGTLVFVQSIQDAALLNGVVALAISPDDAHVYVVSQTNSNLVAYSRDPGTGMLTQIDSESDDAGGVDGLGGASSVMVSPDGRHVYVSGGFDNALAAFDRQPDGTLIYQQVYFNNLAGITGLGGASSVAVSPDGMYLYVAGEADSAIAVFERDPWTGVLSWLEKVQHGDSGIAGMSGPQSITVSRDGSYVYTTGFADDSAVLFLRNRDHTSPDYGRLRVVQNLLDGVDGVDNLSGPTDVFVAPDDRNVYITAFWDSAVKVLQRLPVVIFGDSFDD